MRAPYNGSRAKRDGCGGADVSIRRWIEMAAVGVTALTALVVGILAPAYLGRVMMTGVLTLTVLEVALTIALPEPSNTFLVALGLIALLRRPDRRLGPAP